SSGGISGTGAADQAVLIDTASGPLVAWIDHSAGTGAVRLLQFSGGAGQALGDVGATAVGSELALTTDGTKIAAAWMQDDAGIRRVHVSEYANGAWKNLGDPASVPTAGGSAAPTLAYFGGQLY